jgi:hypothetical protein
LSAAIVQLTVQGKLGPLCFVPEMSDVLWVVSHAISKVKNRTFFFVSLRRWESYSVPRTIHLFFRIGIVGCGAAHTSTAQAPINSVIDLPSKFIGNAS